MLPAVGICLVLIALAVVAWYWLASPPRARFGSATSIGASAPSPLETESARSSAQKNPPTPVTSAAKANLKTEQLAKKPANFDDRKEISAAPSETQHRAWEALTREVPGVQVQFDAVTGAPNHILATGRFLAGPAVPGAGVYDSVLRFIDDHAALFGHGANALGDARITREDVTAQNGMRTVVSQQQVDDIPVYRTILKANLTKDGALVTLGSHFMRDATAATQMDPFERAALIAQPPVDARQAVSLAAAHLDDNVAPEQVIGLSPPENAERKQRFAAPKLSDTVAQLSWLPLNADSARLVWDVTLMSLQRREMFRILVDAKNGKVLLRTSLTADISDATYRVYADGASLQPFDSPTPFSPGYATPQTMQPAEASRSLITTPALDTTASPAGWISDGGTETFGNNVDAHLDLSDVNPAYGMGTHAVSIARVFDFSLDLSQEPSTYQSASVTELFYLCNWYHDKL
ncbi:MAG TPA: M36 family metallopeptidase, partial [Verrucomicrobiaceae bacterium]